ncbi:MAG TPA: hypothetical protein VF166_10555 [Gemmatimonadaceae bacterium]
MTTPVIVAWSGGKDSTLALHEIVHAGDYRVAALLTTVTEGYERISIHGVRRALLRAQTAALGFPLLEVRIPQVCSNAEYEARMDAALTEAAARWPEATSVVHGDIFLEDVRRYRETMLARRRLRGLFPLWGKDTSALARSFLDLGYKAVLTCVDTQAISQTFAGREFDAALLRDLPPSADPCGENGEFHTFVYDGPLLAAPVRHDMGEVVLRDERFAYADLLAPGET